MNLGYQLQFPISPICCPSICCVCSYLLQNVQKGLSSAPQQFPAVDCPKVESIKASAPSCVHLQVCLYSFVHLDFEGGHRLRQLARLLAEPLSRSLIAPVFLDSLGDLRLPCTLKHIKLQQIARSIQLHHLLRSRPSAAEVVFSQMGDLYVAIVCIWLPSRWCIGLILLVY